MKFSLHLINVLSNLRSLTLILTAFISLTIIQAGSASAQQDLQRLEKAKELLRHSDLSRGNVTGIEWDIDIESYTSGRHQEQTLSVKVKDTNSLATFLSPAKVKGRKLLMRDRNMWFIKPGLSKPIPFPQGRNSWEVPQMVILLQPIIMGIILFPILMMKDVMMRTVWYMT